MKRRTFLQHSFCGVAGIVTRPSEELKSPLLKESAATTTGGVTVSYGATNRARRKELESLGWQVAEIPGKGHGVGLDPAAVVQVVREFLDKTM